MSAVTGGCCCWSKIVGGGAETIPAGSAVGGAGTVGTLIVWLAKKNPKKTRLRKLWFVVRSMYNDFCIHALQIYVSSN